MNTNDIEAKRYFDLRMQEIDEAMNDADKQETLWADCLAIDATITLNIQLSTGGHANRALNTEKLLSLLRSEAPNFFELAEVVGKWVWIQFDQKQPAIVTAALSELGFHWNNARQSWQHPCGMFRDLMV